MDLSGVATPVSSETSAASTSASQNRSPSSLVVSLTDPSDQELTAINSFLSARRSSPYSLSMVPQPAPPVDTSTALSAPVSNAEYNSASNPESEVAAGKPSSFLINACHLRHHLLCFFSFLDSTRVAKRRRQE